jgi:class 3 adenylate cyclase
MPTEPTVPTEERKLAAIMFTDMVGYSALAQRDDKLAQELLEEHRRLLREIFPRFHGTEIKTIGDALYGHEQNPERDSISRRFDRERDAVMPDEHQSFSLNSIG